MPERIIIHMGSSIGIGCKHLCVSGEKTSTCPLVWDKYVLISDKRISFYSYTYLFSDGFKKTGNYIPYLENKLQYVTNNGDLVRFVAGWRPPQVTK